MLLSLGAAVLFLHLYHLLSVALQLIFTSLVIVCGPEAMLLLSFGAAVLFLHSYHLLSFGAAVLFSLRM